MRIFFARTGLSLITLLLCVAPVQPVHAAESTSFMEDDNFPDYSDHARGTSPGFTLEGGETWRAAAPLHSTNFSIVNEAPQTSSAVSTASAQSTGPGGDSGGDGGDTGGGRRSMASVSSRASSQRSVTSRGAPRSRPGTTVGASSAAPGFEPDIPPFTETPGSTRPADLRRFFGGTEPVCPPCPAGVACGGRTSSAAGTTHGAAPVCTVSIGSTTLHWFWSGVIAGTLFLSALLSCLGRTPRGALLLFPLIFGRGDGDVKKKKGRKHPKHRSKHTGALTALAILAIVIPVISPVLSQRVEAIGTAPDAHIYNGHLLNASGAPVTTAHSIRFSYWTSADFVVGDLTGGGAINTSAPAYAGWQEEHTVTPDSNGYFSVKLGSTTPLPDFATMAAGSLTGLFIQVEVKAQAAPATSYELLDTNAGDATIDRSSITSVPFARNADLLDQREIGTGSGAIPLLGSGGMLPASMMGTGTNANTFTINADNSTGNAVLQFGQLLAKTLTYNQGAGWFELNDDLNIAGGGLTASGAIKTESGITLNKDSAATDAVVTFGNALGDESLRFSNTNQQFEFSTDVQVQGDMQITGLINGVDINTFTSQTGTYLRASSGGGLNLRVNGGTYRLNGQLVNFPGEGAMAMQDNTTNYVFFTSTGLTLNTSGFPTDRSIISVAEVVTQNGGIYVIRDRRAFSDSDLQHVLQDVYNPTYPFVTYQGDATNNVGRLLVNHDNVSLRNYYVWTSTNATLQDYDVIVKLPLPPDFARWKNNPLEIDYRSTSANAADNKLDISVFDTTGTPVTLSGSTTNLVDTSWTTAQVEFTGTPTWTAGQDILLKFRVYAKSDFQMHLGSFKANYVTGDAGDDPDDLDD